ncbi:MAG: hypothetical protein ACRDQX_02995 [Pseudonocardiaceae bacterium]
MNQYGRLAEEHWRRWLPTRYREIPEPSGFFSSLGREVEERVVALSLELAGDDPPGETYLDKVGRLNMAKLQAEELVLAERVLLAAEPGADPDEEASEAEPVSGPEWIPIREDPAHPFWIENRERSPS